MKQNSAIVISHSRSRGRIPVLIGRTAGMGRSTQWTAVVSAHSHMFLFAPATCTRADWTVNPWIIWRHMM